MSKKYVAPRSEVVELEPEQMLAGSNLEVGLNDEEHAANETYSTYRNPIWNSDGPWDSGEE